jgi:hypothetical protein
MKTSWRKGDVANTEEAKFFLGVLSSCGFATRRRNEWTGSKALAPLLS